MRVLGSKEERGSCVLFGFVERGGDHYHSLVLSPPALCPSLLHILEYGIYPAIYSHLHLPIILFTISSAELFAQRLSESQINQRVE